MKLETKDLRIGNLVIYREDKIIFSVTGIKQKMISAGNLNENCTLDIEAFEPIPLTEKWLIKFGFEKPEHTWIGDKFHLSEWDDYPLNWCVALNKNNAILIQKLKYVHQLQNLYFALTNEELTLKP